MDSYQEKISLLQEMIAFALIDGELHDREYDFLEMVAVELEIEKPVFHQLFKNRGEVTVIKDEFHRICQFYRLAKSALYLASSLAPYALRLALRLSFIQRTQVIGL